MMMDGYWCLWIPVDMHCWLWRPMDTHGWPLVLVNACGYQWIAIDWY